jgi:putative sigma-54 modulation protein
MQLTTHAKNFTISNKLIGIISKKLEKFQVYFDDATSVTIVCSRIGKTEKMEITINQKGRLFRAEASSNNMFSNIDLALAKIEKQIIKHRDKLRTVIKNEAKKRKKFAFYTRIPNVAPAEIMRQKSFTIEKLSVEEAEIAMDTSDHSFYIYANASGKICVMYRRTDGHVGIIEATNSKLI